MRYQIVGEDEADIEAGPDLDHLADRARAGRQERGRRRRRRGAGRHAPYEIVAVRYAERAVNRAA